MRQQVGYEYLASPYSHPDPSIRHLRYLEVSRCAAWLLKRESWVYSPIMHCHEMAKAHALPTDAEFWKAFNHSMILRSSGTLVLKIDGWEKSVGVKEEMEFTRRLGLPLATIEWNFANNAYWIEGI